jgi:hypothetical protein
MINRDIHCNPVEIGFRTVHRPCLRNSVKVQKRLLKGFPGEIGRTQPTLQAVEEIPVIGQQDATQQCTVRIGHDPATHGKQQELGR